MTTATLSPFTIRHDTAPRMELVRVTPEYAAELLERNTDNRRLDQLVVRQYADSMANGRWNHPTSETISIATSGRLLNGQHRLSAVRLSGVPISFWVYYNADVAEFSMLDQGKKRTPADALRSAGIENGNNVASAIRLHLNLERHRDKVWSTATSATTAEVVEFAADNRELVRWAVGQGAEVYRTALVGTTAWAAVAMSVARRSTDGALWLDFYDDVRLAEGLAAGDPAHTLRKWALTARTGIANKRGASASRRGQLRTIVVVKCWNAHVRGEPIRLLKWLEGEATPEPLPSRGGVA